MLKSSLLHFLLWIVIFNSCSETPERDAKQLSNKKFILENTKPGFNPLKHGFNCDSLSVISQANGSIINKLIVVLGKSGIDTISVYSKKVVVGKDEEIIITDFNFDGFCDFVLPAIASASHGGIDHYYFLYDSDKLNYVEVKSLPKFIGGFKLDIKNQRVKIYCPNQDCFAYYKYNKSKKFKLVQGEFKVTP